MDALIKRLEIRHFRLVKAIAQAGSLSAAAKELHLSQSALSHQLKVIEDSVQGALFLRHGKKMVINEPGRRVLQSADCILGELAAMSQDLVDIRQGDMAQIRLATECYTSFHWLPRVIPTFKKQYPGVQIKLQPDISNRLTSELEAGDLDIAIRMSPANDKFQNHILFSDDLVVAMAPSHELAKQESISTDELAKHHLLLYRNGKERLLRALFSEAQIASIDATEMPLTEGILEWCSAGLGVTIIARWAAQRWLNSNEVVIRPLQVEWVNRTWTAVTLKQEHPIYVKDFITLLQQNSPSRHE